MQVLWELISTHVYQITACWPNKPMIKVYTLLCLNCYLTIVLDMLHVHFFFISINFFSEKLWTKIDKLIYNSI